MRFRPLSKDICCILLVIFLLLGTVLFLLLCICKHEQEYKKLIIIIISLDFLINLDQHEVLKFHKLLRQTQRGRPFVDPYVIPSIVGIFMHSVLSDVLTGGWRKISYLQHVFLTRGERRPCLKTREPYLHVQQKPAYKNLQLRAQPNKVLTGNPQFS